MNVKKIQALSVTSWAALALLVTAAACSTESSEEDAPSGGFAVGDGLVAAYSFDEGSGTKLGDATGHGHHGVVSGASWSAAGRYGGALSFDGVNDSVTIPDADDSDLHTAMTLEAWVKPTSLKDWKTVVVKEQKHDVTYALYASSMPKSQPVGIAFTNGAERKSIAASALALGAWSHVAVTYDGAKVRTYVNGAEVASASASGSMPGSSGPLRIGGNAVWDEWFKGLIDEVRVYARALSQSEIQADMGTAVAGGGGSGAGGGSSVSASASSGATTGSSSSSSSSSSGAGGSGGGFPVPSVFVATTGSDANPCTKASPCKSLDHAYQTTSPGTTIEVAAGSYPGQSVKASPGKGVGTETVVFAPAVGAEVTFADFNSYANEVRFIGFHVDEAAVVRAGKNVLIEDFHAEKPYVWGAPAPTPPPENVTFKGGVFVGKTTCAGGESAQFKPYSLDDWETDRLPKNIVLDGIDLGHFELPAGCGGTPHLDCIHTFQMIGFTLRNSRVHDCEHFGVLLGSNGDSRDDDILIENNFFWNSGIADIRPRGSDSPGQEQFENLIVRHNSTTLDLVGQGGTTYKNAFWQDNASVNAPNCVDGVVFGGNLSEKGSACSGDGHVASLGFLDPVHGNYHLAATSPAVNAAKGSAHPVNDIDGDPRPLGGVSDVGADEAK